MFRQLHTSTRHLITASILTVCAICTTPTLAFANDIPITPDAPIFLSEVSPRNSGGEDWLELCRLPDNDPNGYILEHVYVSDRASQLTTRPNLHDVTIGSGECAVFFVGTRLNDGGDDVGFFYIDGTPMSAMTYTSSTLNKSWARSAADAPFVLSDPTAGYLDLPTSPSPSPTTHPSPSSTPTPTLSPTSTPTTTPTPASTLAPSPSPTAPPPLPTLLLSEVAACPATGGEWVEIVNPNAFAVSLTDWLLEDRAVTTESLTGSIPPFGYFTIALKKIQLNNTGDTLHLLRPDRTTADAMEYERCATGNTWITTPAGWQETTIPTPGQTNTAPTPTSTPQPTTSPTPSAAASPNVIGVGGAQFNSTPATTLSSASPSSTPFVWGDLFAFLSPQAETSADILGATDDTPAAANTTAQPTPSLTDLHTPTKSTPPTHLLIILMIGLIAAVTALTIALPTIRRWYTERHAQQAVRLDTPFVFAGQAASPPLAPLATNSLGSLHLHSVFAKCAAQLRCLVDRLFV
jgi:hypothetical protein